MAALKSYTMRWVVVSVKASAFSDLGFRAASGL
jgi:hypothetical protein